MQRFLSTYEGMDDQARIQFQRLEEILAGFDFEEIASDAADTAVTAHEGESDPHPTYTTAAELSAAISAAIATALAGLPTLSYGTYTPTTVSSSNLDSITYLGAQWLRVGNTVTFSGGVVLNATAGGATSLLFSLPVASNFGGGQHLLGGQAADAESPVNAARLDASTASNCARLSYTAVSTADNTWTFHGTYRVV